MTEVYMKVAKVVLSVLIVAAVVFGMVACTDKTGGGPGGDPNKSGTTLTPNSITYIKDITNYGQESRYYAAAAVTYADTTEETKKLQARIDEKKADLESGEDTSSVTKIFAHSTADGIINTMSKAALPADKMTKTIDYLAGEETVEASEIDAKVEEAVKGNFTTTEGWSFFDDWTYYEKLQDRADASGSTDNDQDNVKRQYRNILGKVFAIGMSGDEFGRLATHMLAYATDVVESADMAGATLEISTTINAFDTYCQENLDYETLVYLRAFNDYYKMDGSGTGLSDCVELYGYYYEYNKTNYDSQSDEDFEKQLKYSHMTTYTDSEWEDYVRIERTSYTSAYRYSNSFYSTFYNKHFSFQEKVENHELTVYGMSKWQNKSYTEEMRNAVRNNGMDGQLNFTDWLWCYSGDSTVMKEYNQANTAYQNGKNGSDEQAKEGEFRYNMEQLKMINYILTNMTATDLGRTLRFQVYSYSGEVVSSATSYQKDAILVGVGKKEPADVTSLEEGLPAEDEVAYVQGKTGAILTQLRNSYTSANVDEKANSAASQPWKAMQGEVQTAIDYDYDSLGTWAAKVQRMEDLVVKRKYSCGAAIDEPCKLTPNQGHVNCTKEYDETHNISKFVMNYETILMYMAGQSKIDFQANSPATSNKNNNYVIAVYAPDTPKTLTPGYKGTLTSSNLSSVTYYSIKEITVSSGKTFAESMEEAEANDKNWWANKESTATGSKPTKASSTVQETAPNNTTGNYTYTYTFKGWYLDSELKYEFNENDKISCDLVLYAGYEVTKK